MKMQFLKACVVLCAIPVLMSCGDDTPAAPAPNKPNVLFFHASSGTGNVDIRVDNAIVASNLAFKGNSGYKTVEAGNRVLRINNAGGSLGVDTTASFSNERFYSFFVTGVKDAAGVINTVPLILQDSIPTATGGKAYVRVLNLMTDTSAIDIVLPQGGIVVPGLRNIAYRKASSFIDVDPNTNFEIRATGTPTKLYDLQPQAAGNRVYTIVVTGAAPNGYEVIVNK